jgi:hypothetical protein
MEVPMKTTKLHKCRFCGAQNRGDTQLHRVGCAEARRQEDAYNGWRNYQTWCVGLWVDNDYPVYQAVTKVAASCARRNDDIEGARHEFSKWLENYIEEERPDLGATCFADLLGSAMSDIEWFELAEHYVDAECWEGAHPPGEDDDGKIPPCAASMGCLCAGHARGNPADAACDTRE